MNDLDHGDNLGVPVSGPGGLTADERRFLSGLLAELGHSEPEVREALLAANPDLAGVEQRAADHDWRRLLARVRAVLIGGPGAADLRAPAAGSAEPVGILTSMTRKLEPAQAMELYRRTAPVFAFQMLERLGRGASLDVVRRLVDHLCNAEVQARLRACRHVRDGILREFRIALRDNDLGKDLSREAIERVLEESGAMSEIVAMENCIRLAAARAG